MAVACVPPPLTPTIAYTPSPSGPITVSTTPRQPLSSITLPPASRSPSPEVIDARADPRFATHLRPIFTQTIADQQEKLRQQTTLDAELKEKAQKAKQHITFYLWTTEDAPPTIKIFQDFTWPYLMITSSLLGGVGLLQVSELGNLRIYDEGGIQDWVAIDVGYVMEVHEGQRIFLKDASLRKCVDFHKSLDSLPQTSTPHLHRQLAHERAYVREMHKTTSPQEPLSPPALISLTTLSQQPAFPPIHSIPSTSQAPPIPAPLPVAERMLSPPPAPLLLQGTGRVDDLMEVDGDVIEKRWPMDYYTIDIGNCMRECSSRTLNQSTVFMKCFPGLRFVPSTFSNQRDLWIKAPASLKEEFMELGHRKEGLWSVFAKRARQAQKAKTSLGVIDIN